MRFDVGVVHMEAALVMLVLIVGAALEVMIKACKAKTARVIWWEVGAGQHSDRVVRKDECPPVEIAGVEGGLVVASRPHRRLRCGGARCVIYWGGSGRGGRVLAGAQHRCGVGGSWSTPWRALQRAEPVFAYPVERGWFAL